MGGCGSGNWYRFDTKPTVEGCLNIDVNRFARDGTIFPGSAGTISWKRSRSGKITDTLGFAIRCSDSTAWLLTLDYRVGRGTNKFPVDLPIRLTTTRPGFGGYRWWFVCPLIVNGVPCNRRVGKLYLRGRYFGCRICHDLRYVSSQEAHQVERMFGRELGREVDASIIRMLEKRLKRGE